MTDSALALGLIYAVAQHGSAWILSSSVATPVRNFPKENRGTIVGLTKGFFALSAGFHIELYQGLFRDVSTLSYIGFLGTYLPCLYLLCAVVFGLLPSTREEPHPTFVPSAAKRVGASGLVAAGAGSFAADDNPAPSFRLWTALALPTAAWLVLSGYLQRWAPDSAPLRWGALAVTVGVLAVVTLLPLRYGRLRYPWPAEEERREDEHGGLLSGQGSESPAGSPSPTSSNNVLAKAVR